MNFRPLFDRVVIKPEVNESVANCGIVLPETSQEKPQTGVIVAIGDGENMDNDKTNMKVAVGDRVLFSKFAGVNLKIENENYIVMRQLDILGVFDDRKEN